MYISVVSLINSTRWRHCPHQAFSQGMGALQHMDSVMLFSSEPVPQERRTGPLPALWGLQESVRWAVLFHVAPGWQGIWYWPIPSIPGAVSTINTRCLSTRQITSSLWDDLPDPWISFDNNKHYERGSYDYAGSMPCLAIVSFPIRLIVTMTILPFPPCLLEHTKKLIHCLLG